MLEALKFIDQVMTGNEHYEHQWINHPEKPEKTPSSVVRAAIAKATEVSDDDVRLPTGDAVYEALKARSDQLKRATGKDGE